MNTNKYLYFTILIFIIFSCGESEPILPKEEPDAVSEIVTELNFPTGASNQTVTFTTNKKWEASFSSTKGDVSWCTISPTSGNAGEVNITVTTTENTEYDDRNVILSIKTGKTVNNVKITQRKKYAIILSNSNYEMGEDGETFEIEANANVVLEVLIPSYINWVKVQYPVTRTLSTIKITFIVEKNFTTEPRNAEIIIKDKDGDFKQSFTINQKANKIISRTISIETPGSIKELLGDVFSLIEELKVIGKINGTDINIIREMAGSDRVAKPTNGALFKLDLSDAEVVEGGSAYYYPNQFGYDACYTSNDVIGDFMFYKCNSLKEIILPKTILEIKDHSISQCDNLESIKLFESVKYIGKYGFNSNWKLKKVNLPDNIEKIEKGAFESNLSLESIILPKNINSISEALFFNCKKLKDIEFPNSVTTIFDNAFYGCKNLESIDLPNSITKVSSHAFDDCSNIKSITFGNKIISIGYNAFDQCNRISEIICKNPVPPAISTSFLSSTFTKVVSDNCKVFIPKGSYESYYTSSWRYFENLIETDF